MEIPFFIILVAVLLYYGGWVLISAAHCRRYIGILRQQITEAHTKAELNASRMDYENEPPDLG